MLKNRIFQNLGPEHAGGYPAENPPPYQPGYGTTDNAPPPDYTPSANPSGNFLVQPCVGTHYDKNVHHYYHENISRVRKNVISARIRSTTGRLCFHACCWFCPGGGGGGGVSLHRGNPRVGQRVPPHLPRQNEVTYLVTMVSHSLVGLLGCSRFFRVFLISNISSDFKSSKTKMYFKPF